MTKQALLDRFAALTEMVPGGLTPRLCAEYECLGCFLDMLIAKDRLDGSMA